MAVAHRASLASASVNPTTTFTVVIPSGVLTNDILILSFTSRDHTSGTALPSVTDNDTGGNAWATLRSSTDRKGHIYWKRATSATASKTITVAGCVGSCSGVLSAYSGCYTGGNPWTNQTLSINASGVETHSGFMADHRNSMICLSVFNYANDNTVSATAATNPATLNIRAQHLSTGGLDCGTVHASELQVGIAATGNLTWAQANGTTYSIRFALRGESPAIALNTADATSFGSDTTPTVELTGTDPHADPIRYDVQIGTDATLNAIDSYAEGNRDSGQAILDPGGYGQSITGSGAAVDSAFFFLSSSTDALPGTLSAKIYAHSGTFGTSSVGTGAALAVSDSINASALSAVGQLVRFVFTGANRITLTAATNYMLSLEYAGGVAHPTQVNVSCDSTAPTHGGNAASFIGGVWTAQSYDLVFYLYSAAQFYRVSGTDSGFANTVTGGDTDPFNSGEKVSFTVQAGDALAGGTYYWRVRVKDPDDLDVYPDWSATRTFTITTGGGSAKLGLLGVG